MPFGFRRRTESSDFLRAKRDVEEQAALALRLNPGASRAWASLGVDLNKLGCHEEALLALARAATITPNLAPIWPAINLIYRQLDLGFAAVQAAQMAINLKPGESLHWSVLANALNSVRQPYPALACCDRASTLDPAKNADLFEREFVYIDLKRYAEALAAYEHLCATEINEPPLSVGY